MPNVTECDTLALEAIADPRMFGQSRAVSANFPNLPAAIVAYKDAGRSYADLARALDVSRATVTRWAQGEEPEVKRLQELAKELGVTIAYLAAEEEVAHNDREIRLLAGYRDAPDHIRAAIDQLANGPKPEKP